MTPSTLTLMADTSAEVVGAPLKPKEVQLSAAVKAPVNVVKPLSCAYIAKAVFTEAVVVAIFENLAFVT